MSKCNFKKYNTNHTFAICAYNESPYLESCIKSLINQTVKSNIILCTSTPNDYINNISKKYNLQVFIRTGKSDIQNDWNFAYDKAETDYVTIAHQDDVYDSSYVENLIKEIRKYNDILICITDYMPLKNNLIGKRDINSRIRRLLRLPLKSKLLAKSKFIRKMTLSLGNSICCPSVTYNKRILGNDIFKSKLKFALDWDTFLKIALMNGRFVYIDKPLTNYRIHKDATSKKFIEDKSRIKEDSIMFNKFWPKFLVKFIMIFYKKAYDTYEN